MGTDANAGRVWSWAHSQAEADARQRDANELIGERVRSVRYFTLDYRRNELHPQLIGSGPRTVDAESEWQEPTWLNDGFDAMDYGFEVTTDSGAVFSLTWDPPGEREGIGVQQAPMLGSAVRSDADVAIWTVGERAVSWAPILGRPVLAVDLHYQPWDEERGSLWCPRIAMHVEEGLVEIVMGDSEHGALVLSADNVAVLHPGRALPSWFGVS